MRSRTSFASSELNKYHSRCTRKKCLAHGTSIGAGPTNSFETPVIVVELDDSLNQLSRLDPRAKVIEMPFFGGPTAEESAAVLGLLVNTVASRAARCPGLVSARVRRKSRLIGERRTTAGQIVQR